MIVYQGKNRKRLNGKNIELNENYDFSKANNIGYRYAIDNHNLIL